MTKESLSKRLAFFLKKEQKWLSKGYITDTLEWFYYEKGIKKKYLSETVGRKLRELESNSIIAVKPDGVSEQYKYLPLEIKSRYIPYSLRENKSIILREL